MAALKNEHCCRFCGAPLNHTFVDLGMSPLCESYLSEENLHSHEAFYPLNPKVCHECFLVQIEEYVGAIDIYREYAYFSSYSDSWLKHASDFVDMIIDRLELTADKFVVELASNDGYLLRNFVRKGIPCLGVEPAANVAKVADANGVPSIVRFFGRQVAQEMAADGPRADLIVANNVLAHVPDLHDFVEGIKILLHPRGTATLEFPHLLRLMEDNQYDTIYHEHFSYLSWTVVEKIFKVHGLRMFDVEKLATHGGSIRIYACHIDHPGNQTTDSAVEIREQELAAGLNRIETYSAFEEKVKESKRALLSFLIEAKRSGKTIAGYGAPGKGNTLLNYCGIRSDFLDFTVDRNPYKQGKYLPGTHIPIYPVERIDEMKPDYVLILPWNLQEEVTKQMNHIRNWGGRFVVPIPKVKVLG